MFQPQTGCLCCSLFSVVCVCMCVCVCVFGSELNSKLDHTLIHTQTQVPLEKNADWAVLQPCATVEHKASHGALEE